MAATAIAAIGLGISGFSAYKGIKAGEKQQEATQESFDAQQKIADSNAKLSREVSGITKQQEEIRRRIATLEAMRARRALIRQTQLARATAVSRASAAGASFSSSLAGVMGNITSQSAEQTNEIRTNFGNSMRMFDLNAEIVDAQNRNAERTGVFNAQLATAQTMAAQAAGSANFYGSLGTVGGSLVQNSGTIADVSKSFGGLFK